MQFSNTREVTPNTMFSCFAEELLRIRVSAVFIITILTSFLSAACRKPVALTWTLEWSDIWLQHTRPVNMKGVDRSVLIYLVCIFSTAGASEASLADRNGTQTAGEVEVGNIPVMFSTTSQIIAREGNCVLIDCNVTGEPFPKVQWFNSHGHLLDTEGSGRLFSRLSFWGILCSEVFCNGYNPPTQLNHFHILKAKHADCVSNEHGHNLHCSMSHITCVSEYALSSWFWWRPGS